MVLAICAIAMTIFYFKEAADFDKKRKNEATVNRIKARNRRKTNIDIR